MRSFFVKNPIFVGSKDFLDQTIGNLNIENLQKLTQMIKLGQILCKTPTLDAELAFADWHLIILWAGVATSPELDLENGYGAF